MRIQRILRDTTVALMRQRVKDDAAILDVYRNAPAFAGITEEELLNTTISVPDGPPALAAPAGRPQDLPSHDGDNAILVYNYLGKLDPTQAADTRLWATLAHTTFWDYVRARWGEEDPEKLRTAVLKHWFVPQGGSKAALRTHAISRLWWATHLTVAPWEQDPELSVFRSADRFRFTRVLLKRQQIYFDLIERDYGSDLRLRTCILDALDRYLPSVSWKDGVSREASKRFNLLVKHRQIGSLDLDSMRRACDEIIGGVAAAIAAGAASPESLGDAEPPVGSVATSNA